MSNINWFLQHRLLQHDSARFIVVGGTSAVFYFVLTFAFQRAAGMSATVASGVAYVISFVVTYLTHKRFTFRSTSGHGRALPRYALAQAIAVMLTMGLVHLGTQVLKMQSEALISLGATIVASGSSYVLSSKWAFANAKEDVA
ncbi:GtrA family protein [Pararobbsia silviterrae]|uniref:GtrA family protein n=1 Tax=Pararobbsia silviterrae TaxID=1792498 RepID=A0A494Y8T7_9BURK|nr:GtrA family protein [Pararobbsia silviterrae]RKP59044.1 GtrA family protein [Pararobbsia silviterrae]